MIVIFFFRTVRFSRLCVFCAFLSAVNIYIHSIDLYGERTIVLLALICAASCRVPFLHAFLSVGRRDKAGVSLSLSVGIGLLWMVE